MIKPDKIHIDLKSYFPIGRELEVDRYGIYRVDKLEDGVLHLSPALPRSYKNSLQRLSEGLMTKEAVEEILKGGESE